MDYHFAYVHLYNELNLASVGMLILIMVRAGRTLGDSMKTRALYGALGSSISFVLSDAIFSLCYNDFLPDIPAVQMALKTIYFFSTTGMCLQWLVYFEAVQGETYVFDRAWRLKVMTLLYIHVALLVINWNTGILFGYPDGVTYTRGPLFVVQWLLAYPYAAYASIATIRRGLKAEYFADRRNLLVLGFFPLIPGACGIIQLFVAWIPCACIGVAFEALVLYLSLADQAASRDPLTGLNNRRQVLRSVEAALRADRSEGDRAWFVIMDVDKFKHVNDTYGHVAGDEALQVVADAILEGVHVSGRKCAVGRYGGDEFVLLVEGSDEDDLRAVEDAIAAALERANDSGERPYRLGLSMGVALLGEADTVQSLVERSDEAMYEQKREHHARAA